MWTLALPHDVVGGVCVTGGRVIVGVRDPADGADVWLAVDAATGQPRWSVRDEAPAGFDYGNSPRATPAVAGGVAVTLGATGVMSGIDVETGVTLWQRRLTDTFGVPAPTWGFSATPLIIGEQIVAPVADQPTVVSLDLYTGRLRWRASGPPATYASPVAAGDGATFYGVDAVGYHRRRIDDGTLVWSAERPIEGDFGVPSPVVLDGGVVFVGENNGLMGLRDGRLRELDDELIPDAHTPVPIDDHVIVAHDGLHRIDSVTGEKVWSTADDWVTGYASVIASPDRALVVTEDAVAGLFDVGDGRELGRVSLSEQSTRLLSHPAISGGRLYIVVGREMRCYE